MRLWQIFLGSFHSAATYRWVRSSGKSMLGYVAALITLFCLIVTVFLGLMLNNAAFTAHGNEPALFDEAVTQIADQLPVMTLKDGTLAAQTAGPQVITLTLHHDGKVDTVDFATIDTTGATTHETMKTPILITAREFIYKSDKETKIRPLSDFSGEHNQPLIFTHASAQEMAAQLIRYIHTNLWKFMLVFGAFFFVTLVMIVFAVRLFMLLMLAVIGVLIAKITKAKLDFGQSFALAAVSFTPVTVLDTVLTVFLGYTTHFTTITLAGGVALFAAIRCSEPEAPPAA